ncbi:MAG: glycine C-acetyltransferase [Bdellovibrionales bacterium]|nr:glycine C-acetyltransferase [Bdellovibrionales bacterium]
MYSSNSQNHYSTLLEEIQGAGLYKNERVITSPQSALITVGGNKVLNFCANNYLGLADNQDLIEAAKKGLDSHGFGLSSVRFICGTQDIHKELETALSKFHSTEDAILYAACFDANGGVFEPLLGDEDAIVSDELNHASIIDGIRLCKAQRFRYRHADLEHLRENLKEARAKGARQVLIATDGVFSMDGEVANIAGICELAEEFEALVMVDECHATGFFGPTGRGSVEHCGMTGKVDIITSTLGKALGGAVGGFTTGHGELIRLLRQRSRPYLFSNSLPPVIVSAALRCLELLDRSSSLREKLVSNTQFFRSELGRLGFSTKGDIHPIVPIMLGDARLASGMADDLLKEGVYVIGFSYPVVPKGAARIRVQISAAHSQEDLERALSAFETVGKKHGVIS